MIAVCKSCTRVVEVPVLQEADGKGRLGVVDFELLDAMCGSVKVFSYMLVE